MRISDWSSDVCSSDLLAALRMTFSSLNDRIALSLVSSRADLKYDDLLPTVQELRKAQADWPTAAKTIIKLIERLRPLGLPGSRVAEWAANLHQAAQEIYARSEEHTSELQSLMRISYAVFCLKKKKNTNKNKS